MVSSIITIALTGLFSLAEAGDGCTASSTCRCYPELHNECYTNLAPWGRVRSRWWTQEFPASPAEIGTEFRLFTKNSGGNYWLVTEDSVPSQFDPSKRTVMMIHGYKNDAEPGSWIMNAIEEFQAGGYDYNFIAVDWKEGAADDYLIFYANNAVNTRVVGDQAKYLLQKLVDEGQDPMDIHIIGHSLGAHTAGYAGVLPGGKKVGRITGLDPAGPHFLSTPKEVQLDSSDAEFVDVIHTDSKNPGGFGNANAFATVDFWPNGGQDQPGCDWSIDCNHGRANDLFISSINHPLDAVPCGSVTEWEEGRCDCNSRAGGCATMGFHAGAGEWSGNYYLETTATSPFEGSQPLSWWEQVQRTMSNSWNWFSNSVSNWWG